MEVAVLPNPTTRFISLHGAGHAIQGTLIIFDVHGNEVLRRTIEPGSGSNIDVSGLCDGIYSLVAGAGEQRCHARFLKQRGTS